MKVKEGWGNSKEKGGERDRFSLHVLEKLTNKWIEKNKDGCGLFCGEESQLDISETSDFYTHKAVPSLHDIYHFKATKTTLTKAKLLKKVQIINTLKV